MSEIGDQIFAAFQSSDVPLKNRMLRKAHDEILGLRRDLEDQGREVTRLQGELAASRAREDWRLRPVPEPSLHAFVPHPKFPWFCDVCGYAPHEPLKHGPALAAQSPTGGETCR